MLVDLLTSGFGTLLRNSGWDQHVRLPSTPVRFRRVNPLRRTFRTSSTPDLQLIDGTPGERLVPAPWIPPERDQRLPHGRRARRRRDAVRPPPDPLRASRAGGLGP